MGFRILNGNYTPAFKYSALTERCTFVLKENFTFTRLLAKKLASIEHKIEAHFPPRFKKVMQRLVFLFSLLLLTACFPKKSNLEEHEVKAIKQEIKDRKPRRINDGEISEVAFTQGRRILSALLANTDSIGALKCGYRPSPSSLDSLAALLLEDCALYCDTTSAKLHPKTKAIIAATVRQEVPDKDNLQKVDNGRYWLYSCPAFVGRTKNLEECGCYSLSKKSLCVCCIDYFLYIPFNTNKGTVLWKLIRRVLLRWKRRSRKFLRCVSITRRSVSCVLR